jgi:hypothetical protein|tara:strand:- start:1133 stop:1318 length:186 start_codon:yes stop_codon:yes gene_type:complete
MKGIRWHTYERDDKKAVVSRNPSGFFVELFKAKELHETVEVYGKSERYAEDLAENWVDGVY